MIAGAFAGNAASPFFNIEGSTASVVAAAGFFGISFVLIRYQGNRMAKTNITGPKLSALKSHSSITR